ncbi:KilA-N domain-containing protein [Citrobacter portucalensis]|uniref:KilA-N domain-containing protein n=1 Tax=Citrobacter portucalensis TaxID=1639133 RepID=UPI002550985B|nr:KilA-N domain-containing protein [Citrobacter portucalensis]
MKRTMSRLAKSGVGKTNLSDAVKVPARPKEDKPKTVSLFWNNKLHPITSDDAGMFNLKHLYDSAGKPTGKEPSEWTRYHTDLISKFLIPGNPGFKTKAGRYGGTWVCEELLYAYASWISTQFHKAVLDAFTAAVSGDMVKVREIVRTAVRQEGVPIRKEFASTFMSTDPRAEAIAPEVRHIEFATDQINLAVTGKTAEGIKALTVLKMV